VPGPRRLRARRRLGDIDAGSSVFSTRQLSFLSGLDNTLFCLFGIYAWLLVAWALPSKVTPNIAEEPCELGA
jgi:hypothetical protein